MIDILLREWENLPSQPQIEDHESVTLNDQLVLDIRNRYIVLFVRILERQQLCDSTYRYVIDLTPVLFLFSFSLYLCLNIIMQEG
jgi:hypothetical protein